MVGWARELAGRGDRDVAAHRAGDRLAGALVLRSACGAGAAWRRDPPLPVASRCGWPLATANGMFVPMGFEYAARRPFDAAFGEPAGFRRARDEAPCDLTADDCRGQCAGRPHCRLSGGRRDAAAHRRTGSGHGAAARRCAGHAGRVTRRGRAGQSGYWSRCAARSAAVAVAAAGGRGIRAAGAARRRDAPAMAPGEVRVLAYARRRNRSSDRWSASRTRPGRGSAAARIAIEAIQPRVPDGAFAVKRWWAKASRSAPISLPTATRCSRPNCCGAPTDEAGWHRVADAADGERSLGGKLRAGTDRPASLHRRGVVGCLGHIPPRSVRQARGRPGCGAGNRGGPQHARGGRACRAGRCATPDSHRRSLESLDRGAGRAAARRGDG